MTEPRKTPDWELAERLYRAGQLTLRQIGEQVGCTNAAVVKKAKLKGWERDLTQRIRAAVRAKVSSKGEVSKVSNGDSRASVPISDEEIVEGAVAATLLAVASHDSRRGALKRALDQRIEQLEQQTHDEALFPAIDGLKKLTETAIKIELAEREALGMGNGTECHEDRIKRYLGGG